MPAVRRTRTTELFWKLHGWLFRVSGGSLGGKLLGAPVLLLTTTGRKSGGRRTIPLMYMPHGDACVVIASNAGEPQHPAWWLNLKTEPTASIQRGRQVTPVVAREAEGKEREQLWSTWVARDPSYTVYEQRTSRRIPVVVLEPAGQRSGFPSRPL